MCAPGNPRGGTVVYMYRSLALAMVWGGLVVPV